jgi:hypothetical protein
VKTKYLRIHDYAPPRVDLAEKCIYCGNVRTLVRRIVESRGGFSFDDAPECVRRPFYEYNFVEKLFMRMLRACITVVLWVLNPTWILKFKRKSNADV